MILGLNDTHAYEWNESIGDVEQLFRIRSARAIVNKTDAVEMPSRY